MILHIILFYITVSVLMGMNNILLIKKLSSYKDGNDGFNGFNGNMNR